MKKLISKFSDKLLSKQNLKAVKGGTCYCGGNNGTDLYVVPCGTTCGNGSYNGNYGGNYAPGGPDCPPELYDAINHRCTSH